jgi:hypothetical protein
MRNLLATLILGIGLAAAPGAVNAQFMDITTIVSDIGSRDFLDAVEKLDSASSVRVVRLSTLAGAGQSHDRLLRAVAAKPRAMNYLHSTIVLNHAARWAVRNAGMSIGQIVSVTASNDSAAVLYADDL